MSRQLVKTIKFYSDGTYEEILGEAASNDNETLTNRVNEIFADPASSRRIKFNVAIYTVAKHYTEKGNGDAISAALTYVAANQNVTRATVSDKSFRQLDMSAAQYKVLLMEALQGDVTSFKAKLKEYSGTRTEEYDKQLIDRFI